MPRIGLVSICCLLASVLPAAAAPLLREAIVHAVFTTPTSCEVTATYTIANPSPAGVEHRLHAPDGLSVDGIAVDGTPVSASALSRQGVSLALTLPVAADDAARYELRYRIAGTGAGRYRCPVWLPTVPTDGRSRPVQVRIDLPPGAAPVGSSLPALTWSGVRGEATIGHLPSFLRVPYADAGQAPTGLAALDVARIMDGTAIAALALASALWFWRKRTMGAARIDRRSDGR